MTVGDMDVGAVRSSRGACDKRVVALRQRYVEQQRELERARRELASGRTKSRWALGAVLLLGLSASAWALYPVLQAISRGYILECTRLSTIDCRRLYPGELWFWTGAAGSILLGVLFMSVAVLALFGLRALSRPAPVLQTMQANLSRIRNQLDALE